MLQINFQRVNYEVFMNTFENEYSVNKVPPRGVTTRSVASRKVANREVRTEGSEPAKFGTDEQEVHKRHEEEDEYPHQYDVLGQQSNADAPKGDFLYVDVSGIERRKVFLPGEVSVVTSWQNGEVSRGHSTLQKRADE